MSTSTADELAADDPTVALQNLLIDRWDAALAGDHTLEGAGDPDGTAIGDIEIHYRGAVRVDHPYPQLTLYDVSDTPTRSPYWGWAGDGSGPTQNMRGRIDVRVFVGTPRDTPAGYPPRIFAKRIGQHAEAIVRDAQSLYSIADGTPLAHDVYVNSGARAYPDPGDTEAEHYRCDVEVAYEHFEQSQYR